MAQNQQLSPETVARPVIKWAGGKGQLLSEISRRLPEALREGKIDTYYEPFVGGGAVFFHIVQHFPIKQAFLQDINPELVLLYQVIQRDVEKLITELHALAGSYLAGGEAAREKKFYRIREAFNQELAEIDFSTYQPQWSERAAQILLLNRTCYNGLYRVNSRGHFNVPYGRYKNPKILDADNLRAVSRLLQRVEIRCCDFAEILNTANKRSFIYYDPPYRPISKTASFNAYAKGEFGDEEQIRLGRVFAAADKLGAKQMLSNSDPTNYADDPFFDNLYADFTIARIEASRLINSKSEGRGMVREILVTNY